MSKIAYLILGAFFFLFSLTSNSKSFKIDT